MATAEPGPAAPVGTILVADDEDSIRWVLERACAQNGHTVVAVGSGSEALTALRQRSFDVALVDIKMPDLSGLDVLARSREEGVDTLFIVMTAQNTMANAIEATKRGAYDYLTKPFDLDQVALLVSRALELRRLTRDIERLRIEVRSILDEDYPRRLLTIPDPPPLLYIAGSLSATDELAIAVVGARRGTAAGRLVTERLAGSLAEVGFTIVSGLARGVDAAAHRGALAAGGRTVAVLGCGLRLTYPPEHQRLREEIQERGAVVSELSLDAPPHSAHFPRRNRIISGLSFGVIVTEAAIDSGSLITARLAAEQGREVFAVPGSVREDTSRGTNALIKEGATLVERAEDVIEVIAPQLEPALRLRVSDARRSKSQPDHLGNHDRVVYDALSDEPVTIDSLLERTRLPVPSVMAIGLQTPNRHEKPRDWF